MFWKKLQESPKTHHNKRPTFADCGKSTQIAIEVATTIIEKLHEKGKLSEYTLISIVHSTEDNVWRFEYSIDQRNKDIDHLVDCGCLYVAMDGKEGSVIKAWLEE